MKKRSFVLTSSIAMAHASPMLAVDARAIGRAFALDEDAPLQEPIADGVDQGFVAVIEICGPLTQRATFNMCGYSDGYDAIEARFIGALSDPRVSAVVLAIDSPGGDCAGLFEAFSRMVAAKAAAGKPVFAYADELAASAAYAIACVADRIYLPASGEIGSVGVLAIHCDETAAAAAEGLKYTVFRSGARKAEGNPIEPLSDAASLALQERVNTLAQIFFGLVGAARGMSPDQISALEGAVYCGADAVKKGLADGIASLDLVTKMAGSAKAGIAMTDEEKKEMDDMRARLAKLEAPPPPPSSSDGEGEDSEDEDGDDEDDEDDADEEVDPVPAPAVPAPAKGKKAKAQANARELIELRAKVEQAELVTLVSKAMRDGKVSKGKREATLKLGQKIGKEGLEAFLDALPKHAIASDSKVAADGGAIVLTKEDRLVAKQLGISEKQYATGKADVTKPKEVA